MPLASRDLGISDEGDQPRVEVRIRVSPATKAELHDLGEKYGTSVGRLLDLYAAERARACAAAREDAEGAKDVA